MKRSEEALRRFERATTMPMLVLALLFVVVIALPVFTDLSAEATTASDAVSWLIYAVLAVEISVRLVLAPNRLRYAAHHWFDILIVAFPLLRPLRLARSAQALRIVGGLRVVGPLGRAISELRAVLAYRGIAGGLTLALLAVGACSLAVWRVEFSAGGTIEDFHDALWWALTTGTTVGYGGTYPVTAEGRAIGAVLMLVGIGVFGTVTASVAAFFVETSNLSDLTDLRESLRRIEARLEQR